MDNKLLKGLKEESNYTLTENRAVTYKSTFSGLLDLFAMGGALRAADTSRILQLFTKALSEDKELAIKLLFYLRDIREGQGERRAFRIILKYLGDAYPDIVKKIIEHIPFYGRFDDIFELFNTNSSKALSKYIYKSLIDLEPNNIWYKWCPSINGSKKDIARKIRDIFKLTNSQYRTWMSLQKGDLHLLETSMCMNEWNEINYSNLPSYAMLKHTKAFRRHDNDRFQKYLNDLANKDRNMCADIKINTETLYPYDIIRKVRTEGHFSVLECDAMWNNQKDWTGGTEENILVVCDTSGSMYNDASNPMPLDISTSLAIYFAERNKGVFHNHFITFSSRPVLASIKGGNILEKYENIKDSNWASNTDLQAVFNLILETAKKNYIPEKDMPTKIIVITDMEFDDAGPNPNITVIKDKYEIAGYKLPTLVFWNVQSRQNNVPITKDERGIILVSGSSASTFKALMGNIEEYSPIDFLKSVLLTPRYERIKV